MRRTARTIETRLTVIDKVPADDPARFPTPRATAPDVATLLEWVLSDVPARAPVAPTSIPAPALRRAAPITQRPRSARAPSPTPRAEPSAIELAYETVDWKPINGGSLSDAIYEGYVLQSIRIPNAKPHPTLLVQSAAMASVAPPKPSYRPLLPANVMRDGLLSDAQLESAIYAGRRPFGPSRRARGRSTRLTILFLRRPDDAENAVRFRRGWFLGDGTGAGKGRQVAGVLLDNWLRGRRRALWVSKSDKLLEDAQPPIGRRFGQERLLVTPLSRISVRACRSGLGGGHPLHDLCDHPFAGAGG